jgi:putative transposase
MPRRIVIDPNLRNLDDWPAVAFTMLSESKRSDYLRREQALRRYLSGDALEDIEKRTGVARQQLYNLLRRCLAKHADGRIHGFRGLLLYERIKPYERREVVTAGQERSAGGAAGAMSQLLQRQPAILECIRAEIKAGTLSLTAAGHVRGLRSLHRDFIAKCEALGVGQHQYPLNQLQKGKRTLSKVVKSILNESFARAARASGAIRIAPPWHEHALETTGEAPPAVRPFEVVEFDGHKLDIRLRVRLVDPHGLSYDLELKRVWLLAIIDVASRAVLGLHVVLSSEYDRFDVIRTIQNALLPRRKRLGFSIPGLRYESTAGFASEVAPGFEYACWDWLRLDNARANLAVDTLAALTEFVGCWVDAGPVAQPNERAYIERFFGTIAETLSHRLPGSTGASADDVRRRLTDPGGDTELLVTFAELEELIDVTIANYNGTPHSALGGRSPLVLLAEFAFRRSIEVRQLAEYRRRHLFMIQPPHECEVRGNKATGRRPHINFFGARYSGPVLTHAANLMGTRLHLYFDPLDLRSVQAFLPNGAELGALQANAPWHMSAHSLRLRREILRLKRKRELHYGDADDPVAVYLDHKRKRSRKAQRQAGHRMAEADRALQQRRPAPATEPEPRPPSAPVKPRRLAIGDKGHST